VTSGLDFINRVRTILDRHELVAMVLLGTEADDEAPPRRSRSRRSGQGRRVAGPARCDSLPVDSVDTVYVFSPSDSYSGEPATNVVTLDANELVEFMRAEPTCLPPMVEHWVGRATG
jgi:hypothetical protein